MRLIEHITNRSPYERTFHAVMYELVGIITSAPIISLVTGKKIGEAGLLAFIVSMVAMIWNYVFNLLFDRAQLKFGFKKTPSIRVLHGTIFEVGLVIFTVPIIALVMSMSFLDAFILELAMLIFFFPYTIIFNWGYDKLRFSYIKKHS